MGNKDVEFYTNFDDFDTFLEFKKDLRSEVIESGLDTAMMLAGKEVKDTLDYLVNKQITMNGQTPITSQNATTQQQNALGQPTVDIPKSEEELVKFLTNGKSDPSKYNKAKDYTTLSESNIVFGNASRGMAAANRVTLRMQIDANETVQDQYVKAKQFFQESVFALPDAAGNMNYYLNPGIDLTPYVKIKCSTVTGDGAGKTRKGLNPQERFERAGTNKGYADWTIKQEAVNIVRNNFINITDVLNFIKQGDFDRAREIVTRVDKNDKLQPLKEQLDKLETGNNLPATTQSYANALALINNLKIIKKITQEDVTYTLVSNYSDFEDKQADFFEQIQRAIRGWIVDHEDYWFNSLVKRVDKLIKQYESL